MPLDLSKLMTPQAKQLALTAAVALAFGAIGSKLGSDDPEREAKLVDLGKALATDAPRKEQRANNLDTGEMHRAVKAIRTADPQLVDLGGQLVEAGKSTTAGGNLAKGAQLIAWQAQCEGLGGVYQSQACILGPDAATWSVTASHCEDRDDATWCEVSATNNGKRASRLLVLIKAGP
jgi:hypothetical protein